MPVLCPRPEMARRTMGRRLGGWTDDMNGHALTGGRTKQMVGGGWDVWMAQMRQTYGRIRQCETDEALKLVRVAVTIDVKPYRPSSPRTCADRDQFLHSAM